MIEAVRIVGLQEDAPELELAADFRQYGWSTASASYNLGNSRQTLTLLRNGGYL